MLRITITDTKTNEVLMETFGKCICAGITLKNNNAQSCFLTAKEGTSFFNCAKSVDSAEMAVKEALENQPMLKVAYMAAKFAQKETKVTRDEF